MPQMSRKFLHTEVMKFHITMIEQLCLEEFWEHLPRLQMQTKSQKIDGKVKATISQKKKNDVIFSLLIA